MSGCGASHCVGIIVSTSTAPTRVCSMAWPSSPRSGLTDRFSRRPKFVEFCAAQGWDGGELVVAPEDIEPDVVHDEAPPAGLFARLNPFG